MLEHLPRWLGHALAPVRAGGDRIAVASLHPGECAPISVGSAAFAEGARIPERFTADGEGVSPPLHWGTLPDGTAALALLVEDADSPSLNPLVHAVVWDLDLASNCLDEGAIGSGGDGRPGGDGPETGRNSMCFNCSRCRRSPTSSARRGGRPCLTSSTGDCWGSGFSPAPIRATIRPRSARSALPPLSRVVHNDRAAARAPTRPPMRNILDGWPGGGRGPEPSNANS